MNSCHICGACEVEIEYDGIIRDGGLGRYTKSPIKMYRCRHCDAIWHEPILDMERYYESAEYRESLEGTTQEQDFYRLHDKENLDKFLYTGTAIFRNSVVADIGCGCGGFLDFVSGAASRIIAVEPSEYYRQIMSRKGFSVYPYAKDAIAENGGTVDVITSFDVIEHVNDPIEFMKDYYALLRGGGMGIVGTPTDAPVMRELLGEIYERTQLFSTQHMWVLGEKNLRIIAEKAGFKDIQVKYYQRYGIDNFIGWMREKKPNSSIISGNISDTLNSVWKRELESKGMADYIVMYVTK